MARKAASIPDTAQQALRKAMAIENIPASWQHCLQYIMARESGGNVDIRNPHHSARGLYQLTAANYHFNPRGKDSFGNAVEEAQGGIRYIKQRYKTAENAFAFWQEHPWY
jgi:SLT domain-containing protein